MNLQKLNLLGFVTIASVVMLLGLAHHVTSEFPNLTNVRNKNETYWLLLHRKSKIEYLYYGIPGDEDKSSLIKDFKVMTGVPDQKPTPLPQLLGRDYWLITDKFDTSNSQETAPFFLTLDIPVTDGPPFGPYPYPECNGNCNWEIPGSFGLHGVAGDPSRITGSLGSSGCIRHSDEDITYLYNLLDPSENEIRYYIKDI